MISNEFIINIIFEEIDDINVEIIDEVDNDVVKIFVINNTLDLFNRLKTLNYYNNIVEINIDFNSVDDNDVDKIVDLIKEINEDIDINY